MFQSSMFSCLFPVVVYKKYNINSLSRAAIRTGTGRRRGAGRRGGWPDWPAEILATIKNRYNFRSGMRLGLSGGKDKKIQ